MRTITRFFFGLTLLLNVLCKSESQNSVSAQPQAEAPDQPFVYPDQPPVHFTNIPVDSLLVFPLGDNLTFYGGICLFSPFEKNKIWFTPTNREGFELDLQTGQKTPFSKKFGSPFFQKPVSAGSIHLDVFDRNICWFLNLNKGVFRFDRTSGQGEFFEIGATDRSITTILFAPNYVWIGTSKGLWMYERGTGRCQAVDFSPQMWISHLSRGAGDKVLLRQGYAYDPATHCWDILKEYRGVPVDAIEHLEEAGGFSLIAKKGDPHLYVVNPMGQIIQTADMEWSVTPGGGSIQGVPFANFIRNKRIMFAEPPFFCSDMGDVLRILDSGTGHIKPFNIKTPTFGDNYLVANAPGEIWHCNSVYCTAFYKKDHSVRLFRSPVSGRLLSLQADSDNLYVVTPDTFTVINKRYLSEDPTRLFRMEKLNRLSDSLHLQQTEDWPVRREKLAFLKKQFPGETDPFILSRFQYFAVNFFNGYDEKSLQALLLEADIDPAVIDLAYNNLIEMLVRRGDLREALKTGRTFKKNRPDYFTGQVNKSQNWALLETTVLRLDSLDAASLPEDKRLWAKGNVLSYFCGNSAYLTNEASCYDYSFADSLYRKLVRQFPKSPLADDADYHLIVDGLCYEGEDGCCHPEEVVAWQTYLKKYPDTERWAEILCRMAWAQGREEAELREGLRLIAEAEQLRPEWFSEGAADGKLWIKRELQQMLDRYELDFSAQLKKGKIRRGEPVEIVFTLTNKAKAAKNLRFITDARYPNFSVEVIPEDAGVNCVRPLNFIESETFAYPSEKKAWGEKQVLPGKALRETWDLTKTANKYEGSRLGRFVFDQPGVYQIRAHCIVFAEERIAEMVRLVVE